MLMSVKKTLTRTTINVTEHVIDSLIITITLHKMSSGDKTDKGVFGEVWESVFLSFVYTECGCMSLTNNRNKVSFCIAQLIEIF